MLSEICKGFTKREISLIFCFFFFQSFIHQPKFCLPFMQPGRLIQVKMVQMVGVYKASTE